MTEIVLDTVYENNNPFLLGVPAVNLTTLAEAEQLNRIEAHPNIYTIDAAESVNEFGSFTGLTTIIASERANDIYIPLEVNQIQDGTYPVTFTAKTASGLTVTKTVTMTVGTELNVFYARQDEQSSVNEFLFSVESSGTALSSQSLTLSTAISDSALTLKTILSSEAVTLQSSLSSSVLGEDEGLVSDDLVNQLNLTASDITI